MAYASQGAKMKDFPIWQRLILRLVGRRSFLIFVVRRMIIVNRVLLAGALEFNGDIHRGLSYLVILSIGLEPGSQDLNSQFAVRDPVITCLPFRVGLKFQAATLLLTALINRMHNHGSIADRLVIFVAYHDKGERRQRLLFFLG